MIVVVASIAHGAAAGSAAAENALSNNSADSNEAGAWLSLNAQGVALSVQGRFADALAPLKQALAACDTAGDQRTKCVALVNSNLCLALGKLNRAQDAVPVCTRSLDALRVDQSPKALQQRFYGDLYLADLLQRLHRGNEAEPLFKDAIAIGIEPGSGLPDTRIGNTLARLALLHRDQGRLDEAAGEFMSAVARLRASDPAQAIQALGGLEDVLWRLLRDDEAGAAAEDAVALARDRAPSDALQMSTALSLRERYDVWTARLPEAEAAARECIDILAKYTKPDNIALALRRFELADILADEGKAAEALAVEREVLAYYRQYLPTSEVVATLLKRIARLEKLAADPHLRPPMTPGELSQIVEAHRLNREAFRAAANNRWAEAEDLHRKSVALAEHVLPRDSQRLGILLNEMGLFFHNQERFAEAESFLLRAADIFKIDQPYQRELYGKSLEALARVYENLGEPALAEARYHDALALFKAAHLEDADSGVIALHNYGTFLRNQSRFKEAEEILRSTLASQEKTHGPDRPETAAELNSLGLLYLQWGRYADAEQVLLRALAIQQKFGGPPTESKTFVLINLATLEQDRGRYKLAEEFHRRALSMRERLYGENSAQVARTLRTIADDKLTQWQLPEAEMLVRQAIALGEANGDTYRYQTSAAWQLLGQIQASEQNPQDALVSMGKAVALDELLANAKRRGLVDSLFNQANALFWVGKYQDGIKVADNALKDATDAFSANAPGPLAAAYDKAANFKALAGYTKEASELLQQALDLRSRLFGKQSLAVAYNNSRLLPYLLEQGRVVEAEQLSKQALGSAEEAFGADSPNLAPFLRESASVSTALGHVQAAEVSLRRALRLQQAALPADSPLIVSTLTALANNLVMQGRAQEADPLAAQALTITEAWTGSAGPGLIGPLESMANVLAFEGKSSQAVDTGRRALDVATKVFGAHHPTTAGAMRIVGNSLARFRETRSDAKSFLEKAIAIDKAMPAPVNFWLAADLNNLGLVEEADGELAQARAHLQQSVGIFDQAGFVDSLSMAVALVNLARVDAALGFHQEAASATELAIRIFQKAGADSAHRDRSL
ncbi:MAG TPA: tetratricopeptide repeat protein [Stellaceae bacterium]|nr:tetratricopeptide repeat protein [Stellaceae bacterium]